MKDVILASIVIGMKRVLWFLGLSTCFTASLWLWIMVDLYNIPWNNLWDLVIASANFELSENPTHILVFWGCIAIGTLSILTLFLFIAWRWKSNSNIHQRGAILVSQRGENN